MNTQLIVYPQNYQGSYNSTSIWVGEYLMDSNMFNTVDSSTDYSTSTGLGTYPALFDAINNNPPLVNQWQRYKTPNGTQAPEGSGQLNLYTAHNIPSEDSSSGVYQRLSNLSVGATYILELPAVSASNAGAGTNVIGPNHALSVTALVGDTTQVINTAMILPSGTQVGAGYTFSFAFTAQTPNDTICLSFAGDLTIQDLYIQYPSIYEEGAVPFEDYTDFSDGQVICDLYEDEDIPLTLSIDEFKNAAEQVHSYSKAFTLPATKRNNQIFDNMFEITRTAQGNISFNPYVRTACVVKQEGYILFEGYLRMLEVEDKEGEISYNVNLYSEAVALADVLGDRTLANLGFEELDHDYNITSITNSWNDSGTVFPYTNAGTSGFRSDYDTIKYPFCDWTHQFLVSDGTYGTAGMPQLTNLEQAFRPFIQIKYLIDRIFSETNQFSYTSTFLNTADFKKLYMDFNWGADEFGAADLVNGSFQQWDDGLSVFFIDETSYTSASKLRFNVTQLAVGNASSLWDNTNYRLVSNVPNLQVDADFFITLLSTASTATYSNFVRVAKFNSYGHHLETFAFDNSNISAGDQKIFSGSFSTTLQSGDYIQAQSYVNTPNKIKMDPVAPNYFDFKSISNDGAQADSLLTSARGDIGQWALIKGIMTMFNLITMPDPDNPNNIIIEPYGDIFIDNTSSGDINDLGLKSRGIEHDWTDKIDLTEIKLNPLTDLNKKTIFKFVEDEEDEAFRVYQRDVVNPVTGAGHLYGSLVYDASGFTVLDGEQEIVADPFGATISKPLMFPQYPDLIVPSIYSMDEEGQTSSFDNSPRIMYNNGVKTLSQTTYYIPTQNGGSAVSAKDSYLQFSHLTSIPTVTTVPPAITDTEDFHFGACQLLQPIGNPTANNLFNMYWAPYYNELYNADTRTMTIKVNLSAADINTFKFTDTVMIKNREFRVNKIDYKPNDLAVVEFILIP